MGNTKNKPLSSIKEGECSHCGANLTFSESERRGVEKIKCPKCEKVFEIEEVKVLKGKKGCLIAVNILVGLAFIGIMTSGPIDEEE
jgi:phage FluMu protein Com